jgi:DNA-binding NtrC family response regulator
VPPLRRRREDIPLLADRFLSAAAERQHKSVAGLDAEAMEVLAAYAWPGNVRELRNEIERAVALTRNGEAVSPDQLSPAVRTREGPTIVSNSTIAGSNRAYRARMPGGSREYGSIPLRQARAAFEANHIIKELEQHQGNVSRVARALGLSRSSLQKKMKDYGLR